jgi:hypothetical protein
MKEQSINQKNRFLKTFLAFLVLISLDAQAAKTCQEQMKQKKMKKVVVEETLNEADNFQNIQAMVTEHLNEARKVCLKGIGSTVRFCGHMVVNVPRIALSIWKFEPNVENFREEIILPLSDILIRMKSSELDAVESEKTKFEFILFWPELVLKVQKLVPVTGVGLGFAAVKYLPKIMKREKEDPAEIVKNQIRNKILKKFWSILKTRNEDENGAKMTYIERLQFALNESLRFDDDQKLQPVVDEVRVELGLDRLQEALSHYSKNDLKKI